MDEQEIQKLRLFAKKIAIAFYQNGLKRIEKKLSRNDQPTQNKALTLSPAKKLINLTKQQLHESIEHASKQHGKVTVYSTVDTDYLFKKRIENSSDKQLLEAALDAHKCCDRQEFHLMPFKKLLLENGLSLRQVKNWKLPESEIAKQELNRLIDHLKTFSDYIETNHKVTILRDNPNND